MIIINNTEVQQNLRTIHERDGKSADPNTGFTRNQYLAKN